MTRIKAAAQIAIAKSAADPFVPLQNNRIPIFFIVLKNSAVCGVPPAGKI